MVSEILVGISSAAGGAMIIYVGSKARKYIGKRVKIESPEAATLAQVVPAVNALIQIQGPQTDALIALLEASKGQCNGNVDRALATAREGRAGFQKFLTESAKVELREAK